MPTCQNCGEEEFECIDGLYYCTECQTQTQDLLELVEAEQPAADQTFGRKIHSSTPREKFVKKADKGRPWKTHEGFQIILREQVRVLIKLGAKPQLEEAVWRLWVRFLSKTGVAFTDQKKKKENVTQYFYPRPRDVASATVEKPGVSPFRFRKTYYSKYDDPIVKRKREKEMEKAAIRKAVGEEEFYEEDNPYAQSSDDDSEEDTEELGKEKKGTFMRLCRSAQMDQIERLSLLHTLTFCFLGLFCTHHLVTVADLIRWVRTGTLPYNQATHLFPSDMKFSTYDYDTFCCAVSPKEHRLRRMIGRLVEFLDLQVLPEVDLRLYISKYIIQLNLPGEMHFLVHRLLKIRKPQFSLKITANDKSFPQLDAFAMAYIIIILKSLFGLNGYTEVEISRHVKSMMKLLPEKLFSWCEWRTHMEWVSYLKTSQEVPDTVTSAYHITDVRGCIDKSELKSGQQLRHCESRLRNRYDRGSTREGLLLPLKDLQQKMDEEERRKKNPGILDAFHNRASTLEVCSSFLRDSEEEATGSQEQQQLRKDFSGHSLKYITENENYIAHLESQGLSEVTMMSAVDSGSSYESESEPELDPSQDLFINRSKPRKRKLKISTSPEKDAKNRNHIRKAVMETLASETREALIENQQELENLLGKIRQFRGCYTMHSVSELAEHSESVENYKWLLEFCTNMAECTASTLEDFVKNLEEVYISENVLTNRSSRGKKLTFWRKYFSKS